ncbi:MAG: hypothetical protein ACREFF_07790 [Candidatus Udaeobacter sp.]
MLGLTDLCPSTLERICIVLIPTVPAIIAALQSRKNHRAIREHDEWEKMCAGAKRPLAPPNE